MDESSAYRLKTGGDSGSQKSLVLVLDGKGYRTITRAKKVYRQTHLVKALLSRLTRRKLEDCIHYSAEVTDSYRFPYSVLVD
jgi:hypothetical protein